jgi:hypothetical protein
MAFFRTHSIKTVLKLMFTKNVTYYLKRLLIFYCPWLLCAIVSTVIVQVGGFWVAPITQDTMNFFFKDAFTYSLMQNSGGEYESFIYYVVLLLLFIFMCLTVRRFFQTKNSTEYKVDKSGQGNQTINRPINRTAINRTMLFLVSAVFPVALLLFASLRPFRSIFMLRYLLPSVVFALICIALFTGVMQKVLYSLMIILFLFGITNVFHFGNYAPETETIADAKSLTQMVNQQATSDEIYIASTPWFYYDVYNYVKDTHRIYYLNESLRFPRSSEKMLADETRNKLQSINDVLKKGDRFWFLGNKLSEVETLPNGEELGKTLKVNNIISVYQPLLNKDNAFAIEYEKL